MLRRNTLRNRRPRKSARRSLVGGVESLEDRRVLTTFVDVTDLTPDGGGCGSFANPCGTIGGGIMNAPAGGEVYVAGGVYAETISITKDIHLRGEAGAVTIDGILNGFDITGATTDVKLEDLTVIDSLIGIRAAGISSLELENVTSTLNIDDGVTVMGAGSVTIEGGSYDSNGLNGITLDSITGPVWMSSSSATVNGDQGLDVRVADSVTIVDSAFTSNGGDGALLTDVAATGIEVYLSIATSNFGDGIEIGDSLGTISVDRTDMSMNGGSGLNVNNMAAGDIVLRDNVASFNGAKGASIVDSESVSDTNGTYEGNDDGGMEMRDIVGTVVLVNTTATDNVTEGVEVAPDLNPAGATSVAILGGTFADTAGIAKAQATGIQLVEIPGEVAFSKAPTGAELTVSGHTGDGVVLDAGGRAEIEGGIYKENGLTGLKVIGYTETEIEDASSTDNLEDGVGVIGGGMATVRGGTYDSNGVDGLYFDAMGAVRVQAGDGLTANMNGDGLFAVGFGELSIEGGTFADNTDSGIEAFLGTHMMLSEGVTATGNLTGVYATDLLEGFSDEDGSYTMNDVDGILLRDIGGVAVLHNTNASDNDADANGIGDGLHVEKGATPFGVAADLVIEGGSFNGQERGIHAADVGAGVFLVPGGPGMEVTAMGNADNGAFIEDSGPVTAVRGDYSGNGTEGFRVLSTPAVFIDGLTSSFNGDDGVELDFFGDAMIFDVTATNNVIDGMNLGGGFDVTIDGGVYDENGDNGIAVSLSGDVAISNTSMDLVGVPALFPLNAGISILDNTSVLLENNSITNTDRVGVDVELTPTLTLITTSGNVKDAVTVEAGSIHHTRAVGTANEVEQDALEYSDVTALTVDTVDSDDEMTVHLGAALPPVSVVGGEQHFSDTLTAIRAVPTDTVTVTGTTISDGVSTIAYTEIEKVVVDEGDLNFDGNFDLSDIDTLVDDIVSGNNTPQYELTGDTKVDNADLDAWLALAGAANLSSGNAYFRGDANLDGFVDGLDFISWNNNKFTTDGLWSGADFNADGVTDGLDFVVWNNNKFMNANAGDVVAPPVFGSHTGADGEGTSEQRRADARTEVTDLLFANLA